MAAVEEIKKAVGAHGMWKQRLKQAIDSGKSDFTVDRVRVDNMCDFGKWLYSLAASDQTSAHWKSVRELHAKFHAEAAHVLSLAVSGHKQDAEKGLATGSNFAKISSELTGAMMKWVTVYSEK
jgi:chemoreceptor zinc-binding protein